MSGAIQSREAENGFFSSAVSDLLTAFGLCLCALVFLLPNLIGQSLPFDLIEGEVLLQWIPYHYFFERSLSDGVFPLWTSNVFMGFPIYAFSHTGFFYLFNFHFLPLGPALSSFLSAHLCMFVAGCYFLFRNLGGGRAAAAAGAALSITVFLPSFRGVMVLPEMALMPWLYLSFFRLLRRPSFFRWLLFVALMALMVMAGQVELLLYIMISLFFAMLIYHRDAGLGFGRDRVLAVLVAGALALLASSVQWAALLEYLFHSVRSGGLAPEYLDAPERLFLVPLNMMANLIPMEWPERIKSGSVILLVSIAVALAAGRSRRKAFWLVVLGAGFVLNIFPQSPVHWLTTHLPVLNRLVRPSYAYMVVTFLLLMAAAEGLKMILEPPARRLALASGLALGVLSVAGNIAAIIIYGTGLHSIVLAVAHGVLVLLLLAWRKDAAKAGAAVLLLVIVALVEPMVFAWRANPRLPVDSIVGVLPQNEIRGKDGRFALVTSQIPFDSTITFNLGLINDTDEIWSWITLAPRRAMDLWSELDPSLVEFDGGKLRTYKVPQKAARGRYINQENLPFLSLIGLRYVYAVDQPFSLASPYPLEPYLRSKRSVVFKDEGKGDIYHDIDLDQPAHQYCWWIKPGDRFKADLLCAGQATLELIPLDSGMERADKILWTAPEGLDSAALDWSPEQDEVRQCFTFRVEPEGSECRLYRPRIVRPSALYKLTDIKGAALLFENQQAFARAFLVGKAFRAGDREAIDFVTRSPLLELKSRVAVAGDAFVPPDILEARDDSGAARPPGEVSMIGRAPGRVDYQVSASRQALLFESEAYYPGWRVFVDGKETRLLRSDHAFRAMAVPAGEHRVTLRFEPASFRVFLWVSVVSLFCWAAALVRALARPPSRKNARA